MSMAARFNRRPASGNDNFSSVTSFTASSRNSFVYLPLWNPFHSNTSVSLFYLTLVSIKSILPHFGSKVTNNLYIHISFQGGRNQYEINLQPTDADELIPKTETVYWWNKAVYPNKPFSEGISRVGKEAGISSIESKRIAKHVRDYLDRWRLYHFHDTSSSSPMKITADLNDNHFLRPDGSNLAAFFYIFFAKNMKLPME